MRPLESVDITAAYEHMMRKALEICNSGQEVEPQVFFLEMSAEQPGEVKSVGALGPDLTHALLRDERTKQVLMAMIRDALRKKGPLYAQLKESQGIDPDIAVHVTEAWMKQFTAAEAKKVNLDRPLGNRRVSELPDRVEVLMVAVHTADRTYQGLTPIKGKGKKRRAQFVPLDLSLEMTGRMTIQDNEPLHRH